MTKDEALRLALEALTDALDKPMWNRVQMESAITAIKAALEAKDEPVKAWCETCEGGGKVYQEHQAGCWVGGEHACPDCDGNGYYTTPPQRTWVGLTDEEVTWLCNTAKSHEQTWGMFVRAIEAKLKEKNT